MSSEISWLWSMFFIMFKYPLCSLCSVIPTLPTWQDPGEGVAVEWAGTRGLSPGMSLSIPCPPARAPTPALPELASLKHFFFFFF